MWLQHAADWFALKGDGYQFWSGIGSGSPLLAGLVIFVRHHNCHEKGCWRMQFKPHPDDADHLVCRKHHAEAVYPPPTCKLPS